MGSRPNWWYLVYAWILISGLAIISPPASADGMRLLSRQNLADSDEDSDGSSSLSLSVFYDPESGGSRKYGNWEQSGSDSESASISINNDDPIEWRNIGCYDGWENTTGHYLTGGYSASVAILNCEAICRHGSGPRYPNILLLVKGQYCDCLYWENFAHARVDDRYCSIPCTDRTDDFCGGNFAYSVYCDPQQENCSGFVQPEIENLYEGLVPFDSDSEEDGPIPLLSGRCVNCTEGCYGTTRPEFDYLPLNSPYECVKFCRREIHSYSQEHLVTRYPTPFAAVGWMNKGFVGIPFPACSCLETEEVLVTPGSGDCTKPCPEPSDQICGANINFLVNVYSTGVNSPGSTTSSEEVGSTSPTSSSEEETSAPSPSPPIPSSSSPSVSTSTAVGTTVTQRDPKTTTSWTSPPEDPCSVNCTGRDVFGRRWTGCAGKVEIGPCSRNSTGLATWNCLPNGIFEGESPDYSQCTTVWIQEFEELVEKTNITYANATEFLATLKDRCEKAKSVESTEYDYFGHEIEQILRIVERILKHENLSQNIDLLAFESLTSEAVFIGSSVLTNLATWDQLRGETRSRAVTKLLHTLEESMFELTSKATGVGEDNYTSKFDGAEAFRLVTGVRAKSSFGNTSFTYAEQDSWVTLPPGWTNALQAENISFLGMTIDPAYVNQVFPNNISGSGLRRSENLLAGSNKSLNGKLMAFSLARPSSNSSVEFPVVDGGGVQIHFEHDAYAWGNGEIRNIRRRRHVGEKAKAVLGTSVCVYWDTDIGEWSTNGCKLIGSEAGTSHCECYHLTAFAVLMSHHNYVGKDFGLEILTLILCPLSVACLFATIAIFSLVRSTHGQRTTITKNLAFCLLVGHTFVLLVTDRHYFNMSEAVCTGAALFIHYVFLSAFMWMLVEGYHLYKMVVHVFDSGNSYMTIYRVFAYGLPLIIVGITGVVGFLRNERAYGGDDFCWLQGNYIWSFNVPVAIIVMMNLVVLFITMKIAYRVQSSPAQIQARPKSFRTWIKGCISITVLLGLTWITGFFMMSDTLGSNIAAYFFTILNASQGVLLCVFHCLLNEKVRVAAERRNINLPIWLSASGTNSTDPSNNPPSSGQGTTHHRANANMKSFFSETSSKEDGRRGLSVIGGLYPIHNKLTEKDSGTGTVSSFDSSRASDSDLNGSESNGSQVQLVEAGRRNLRD